MPSTHQATTTIPTGTADPIKAEGPTSEDIRGAIANSRLAGVSYRDTATGDPTRIRLKAAARTQFENESPIREPMAYQGQWSKSGYYLMARTGNLVSYESRFEMAHLMLLDRDRNVAAVAPQPFRLHWTEPGKRARTHVPDFFVRRHDDSCEVIDVKGSRQATKPHNALVFGITARACNEMRMGYRVATDIHPVMLANQRWLAAYRFESRRAAELGPHIIDTTASTPTIAETVRRASNASGTHPAHVKATLYYLIWDGFLHCNLNVPLSGETRVHNDPQAVGHVF